MPAVPALVSRPTSSDPEPGKGHGFAVRLDVFEGPFDLLLGLIAKHELDVTEVALSKVTDDFIAYIRSRGSAWDLGQATEFLVVASTLLDLKAARLLPAGEVVDEEDLALLEARDLLFARLLQYRAYKEVAAELSARMAHEARRHPRAVTLEPAYANLLPEVLLGLGPVEFAALAARALTPRPAPTIATEHLHVPRVSVREQAVQLAQQLRRQQVVTFRSLTYECELVTVVARFLALLELFREGAVAFEQVAPLTELHVRWTGADETAIDVGGEFDDDLDADDSEAAEPSEPAAPAAPRLRLAPVPPSSEDAAEEVG